MRLESMTFKRNSDGEVIPDQVTVTMGADEALWIAMVAGRVTPGQPATEEIYGCLAGDVFNRYWDDGVGQGAQRDLKVDFTAPHPKYIGFKGCKYIEGTSTTDAELLPAGDDTADLWASPQPDDGSWKWYR